MEAVILLILLVVFVLAMLAWQVVQRRRTTIFRPPITIGLDGEFQPGVNQELAEQYFIPLLSELVQVPVTRAEIKWQDRQGRFCKIELRVPGCGQSIDLVYAIMPVTQRVEDACNVYRAGIVLKARELRKAHQCFDEVNNLIRRALRGLDSTRHDLTDDEFLFVRSVFDSAPVRSV